jgi:hypothetical protein
MSGQCLAFARNSTLLGRKILRSFNTGKYTNAVDASKKLEAEGTPLSPQTVSNFLVSTGFKSGQKKVVLLLTPSRCKARLAFAKKYRHFTKDDWLRRVYTVETKINRLGSDGKQWTWTQGGWPLKPTMSIWFTSMVAVASFFGAA